MVLVIQLIGALFGVFFLYMAFISLKKKELTVNEWTFWSVITTSFIVASLYPQIVDPITRSLNISRKMDFFIIIGFMVLLGISFQTHLTVLKSSRKMEEIVRKVAIDEAKKK